MPLIPLPKYTFINGPPSSGKSTLATLLCRNDETLYRESFAQPVRDMMYAVFYPEEGPICYELDLRDSEVKKKEMRFLHPDAATERHVISNRDAMISFSEAWMKPTFGEDIFGRLALDRCKLQEDFYSRFIFDDSGFAPEAQVLIDQGDPEDFLLILLNREGCDFKGDSRSYINLPINTVTLFNSSSPEAMLAELELLLGAI